MKDMRTPQTHQQPVPKGMTMTSFTIAAITAGALASAGLGLAGAATAAPSGPVTADQTVSQLQAAGYNVIVNKTGTMALHQCAISAVRPGQTYSRTDNGVPGAN